jgi:hypothetical protein
MKLTIVIVTFERDFDLLKRLLSSIQQFWEKNDILEILILLNSDNDTVHRAELDLIVNENSSPIPIRILTRQEVSPDEKSNAGYSLQMKFKLFVAAHVKTDWYLIHDSKDFYVDFVKINDYFDDDGKVVGMLTRSNPCDPLVSSYNRAADIWQNAHIDTLEISPRPPHMANTQLIIDLLNNLQSTLPKAVNDVFFDLRCTFNDSPKKWEYFTTEFGLINAYLDYTRQKNNLYSANEIKSKKLRSLFSRDKNLRRGIET